MIEVTFTCEAGCTVTASVLWDDYAQLDRDVLVLDGVVPLPEGWMTVGADQGLRCPSHRAEP